MTATATTKFAGVTARKMPKTRKHRLAMWECMLGTVYARNEAGQVRYFDYDLKAAAAFAGVGDRDERVARVPRGVSYAPEGSGPRPGAWALWILRAP